MTNPNTNEILYSTTLNTPTGTINYTPSNRVNVTGYYRFQKAHEKVSNKITKSVGTDKLDDTIDYSITSNGSSVSNGSTITSNLITIKVNAQNSSNTISIDFYTSDGNAYGDSIEMCIRDRYKEHSLYCIFLYILDNVLNHKLMHKHFHFQ